MAKNFVYYVLKTYGINEIFFEQLNEACLELERGMSLINEIRKKYKMLHQLLLDQRILENTDAEETEYTFASGDKEVRTFGFLGYGYNVMSIPMNEIERMGKWLQDNQGIDIPQNFYNKKIKRVVYSIEQVKECAQMSKQPLSLVNRAYEVIKSIISRTKETNKRQEESER